MNFFYTFYFLIPSLEKFGILGKAFDRIQTRILKRIFDRFYYHKLTNPTTIVNSPMSSWDGPKVIVSLTSFPKRIEEIPVVINTIFNQSIKPDKIILWLAEEQFPGKKIPYALREWEAKGLIIRFCDDIKSYKKFYYTMLEFPDHAVVLVDDDVYYPEEMLENLLKLSIQFPKCIVANRAHMITFQNEKVLPYKNWKHNSKEVKGPSHRLVPTGVGGVLYPPGVLHEDVFEKELFKELAFFADDLWLKIMAFKKGTKVVTNSKFNKDFVTVGNTQKEKLVDQNVTNSKNDFQFSNLIDYFEISEISFDD